MWPRIVLVNDDHKVLVTLASALTCAGYDVVAFGDVKAARSALRSRQPIHLLITQAGSGIGPSGISLARVAHARLPATPVIFIAPQDVDCFTEGLGLTVRSPIEPSAVVAIVSAVIDDPSSATIASQRRSAQVEARPSP